MTWWDDYNRYLASPQWQRKRQRVLERDRNYCQAQLPRCTQRAEQVHHLPAAYGYPLGEEPVYLLQSICRACHERITQIDRERRASSKRGGILGGLFGRGKR